MLRVLVPWPHLEQALQRPGIEPILWDINTGEPPAAEMLITERPVDPAHRSRVARIAGLKHVHLLSLGYEWVLEHLPAGATLSHSRGAVEDATAEHALALILASLRQLPTAAQAQREHRWERTWTGSLDGARVLLLGVGGVGREIARRIEPFKPTALVQVGRTARAGVHGIDELHELLPQADVVVIALPHTGETEQLVDAEFLARLHDGALLVNVGRGKIVDTPALLAELQARRLRAALDVTDPEPLPAEHALWSAPNCIITPHMAGDTAMFMQRVSKLAVSQAEAMADGDPLAHVIARTAVES